ncbi:MAG: acyl-CoA dehydrogenase family protein [Gaiellaceae bacterium]
MENDARAALAGWEAERPTNFYDATPNLARALCTHRGGDVDAAFESRLREFGATVAQVVEPAAQTQERDGNGPRLVAADALGRELQEIEFHPAHDDAGRAVWKSGLLSAPAFEQAPLMYLLAHAGEAGQACPFACTAGLVRALRAHGSAELQARFLPPLLVPDYDRAERGAQFLTEVQGGSDVGANVTAATPDELEPGAWRLHGEKWFCSVADADQFVVTARPVGAPVGTDGIACFLVPRRVGGWSNGFRIRRLKDKLGTRALATAEIEFEGALAYPLGELADGFKIAAGVVLNTSRWLNACGSVGLMRRAYLEASGFARHRTAFGRSIDTFPLVRENLALIKAEELAALASTLALTALIDRLDRGATDDETTGVYRFLVNANKYLTSLTATLVVRRAIETLGGNGTIEDFSPLPRLYRDAIVFESWEGAHNVLVEQVRRDAARFDLVPLVLADLRDRLAVLEPSDEAAAVVTALADLEPRLERGLAEPLHFRRQLGELVRALQATWLLVEASAEPSSEKADVAAFFVQRRVVRDYDPEADGGYALLIDRVLADDVLRPEAAAGLVAGNRHVQ